MWGGVRKKGAEEYVRSAGGKKKGKNKGRSQKEERQWAGNQEKKNSCKRRRPVHRTTMGEKEGKEERWTVRREREGRKVLLILSSSVNRGLVGRKLRFIGKLSWEAEFTCCY